MSETQFAEMSAWIADAALAGQSEIGLLTGFCERAVAAGLPLARAAVFIDTLHPVHEGRVFRWGHADGEATELEYGRTSASATPGASPSEADRAAQQSWRKSAFAWMLEKGELLLRRRLPAEDPTEFSILPDLAAAGLTDYVALIIRFAAEGTLGEMDCLYSSWATHAPDGFSDDEIAALQRLLPFLALAIKSQSLRRIAETLVQTYLGRDAGKRVLSGRIMRGIADRVDTVLWFSDLRGFTRVTQTAPKQVISLLNDYADVIISAIHEKGGDVLKLMGDGTLAIFTLEDRARGCAAALAAAIKARKGISQLNARRDAAELPTTDMYLGLHVGVVFYGNIGSIDRLDFTVIGPSVNEVSRIAEMCGSVEQPMLVSAAFAQACPDRKRFVSVGRYALRGLERAQELFTLDPQIAL